MPDYMQSFSRGKDCFQSGIFPHFQAYIIRYSFIQLYTYRVLQRIQMKLMLLCVWAEGAVLGKAKTALKFKYEI